MLSIHEMVKHTLKTIAANTQVFQRVFEHFTKVKTSLSWRRTCGNINSNCEKLLEKTLLYHPQQTIYCSISTIETIEKDVKYVHS